ncbi:hypothetical protein SH139x_004251 [Planctomycetaceae bacterium SH139]
MTARPKDRLKERDAAMRKARNAILKNVGVWLVEQGFAKAASGHFTRRYSDWIGHVGFQKHSSGRNVRVMCHAEMTDAVQSRILGPLSDAYERPNSPNGTRYNFGWSTREQDMARCKDEYCRYLRDVVLEWLGNPTGMAEPDDARESPS